MQHWILDLDLFHSVASTKINKIYSKTAKLWKSGAALKSQGEKSWEIKGSGQECMAAMMLMLINFNSVTVKIY